MSHSSIRRLTLNGFVNEVRHIHESMPDRRFCFVLGAGASKTSRIPTAGELGVEWLKKIHTERGGADADFAAWLDEGNHGIEGLQPKTSIADIGRMAAAYPAIYRAKWGHDPAQGHAEIEKHIEAAKPSYGYYALAEILASDDVAKPSRHNVVITPNFDNLPAEALGVRWIDISGHRDPNLNYRDGTGWF
jgi:NAD-dependent SIR2 family protein deacetylase